jgi:hypothetical protein
MFVTPSFRGASLAGRLQKLRADNRSPRVGDIALAQEIEQTLNRSLHACAEMMGALSSFVLTRVPMSDKRIEITVAAAVRNSKIIMETGRVPDNEETKEWIAKAMVDRHSVADYPEVLFERTQQEEPK